MMNRRSFLKNSMVAGTGWLLFPANLPGRPFTRDKITVIHTGHLSETDQAAVFRQIHEYRKKYPKALILDSGNLFARFHGFGQYHGISEIRNLNAAGYLAFCPGAAELENGQAKLASVLAHSLAPAVSCNLGFSDTYLGSFVKTYLVVESGGYRIGITGLSDTRELRMDHPGLRNISIQDPVRALKDVIQKLRTEENCDRVIALSQYPADHATWNQFIKEVTTVAPPDCILFADQKHDNNTTSLVELKSGRSVLMSHSVPGIPAICTI